MKTEDKIMEITGSDTKKLIKSVWILLKNHQKKYRSMA
jgi:hypothetical protein